MIIHLFNSSSISGPERLVVPALATAREQFVVINLREERIERLRQFDPLEHYAKSFKLDYGDVRVCGLFDYVAIQDLRILLDRLNPDLVHAHDAKASTYLLYACQGGSAHYPIVSTHHGVQGRPDLKTRVYEQLYRRYILRSYDRTLAVSTADYECLLKSGIPENRLRLHLNGIDGSRIHPTHQLDQKRLIRSRWLPETSNRDTLFLLGAIGRLSSEKDHARLLLTLRHLQMLPTDVEWRCLIFGTGPLENSLRRLTIRYGLEKRIIWMGYRNDIGNELAGLDLVLSFSKAEGLPISLIEAGWAGTPVLCTRVGGIKDLMPDESYGIGISPSESPLYTAQRLLHCLSVTGRALLQQKALRFQERVSEEFTQVRWMQRLSELYGEVGVSFGPSAHKTLNIPFTFHTENGDLRTKLQTTLFTRLLMYQSGRLNEVRDWNQKAFRILMYHRFYDGTPQGVDTLAKQCAHLVRHYNVVSLTQIGQSLRNGTPLPPNAVALTVDDGYRDFLFNAHSVFRSYHIPVTVFLTTGFIDGTCWLWWDRLRYLFECSRRSSVKILLRTDRPPTNFALHTPEQRQSTIDQLTATLKQIPHTDRLRILADLPDLLEVDPPHSPPPPMEPLRWTEVRRLAEEGVDFGAHTQTHPILARIEDPDELQAEIRLSKECIEHQLSRPVFHFAYPNGLREDVNNLTLDTVAKFNFLTAVTAERGINFEGAHPLWLHRLGVEPFISKFNLEVLVAGLGGSRSSHPPYSAGTVVGLPEKVMLEKMVV